MQKNIASQRWTVFAFYDNNGTTPGSPVTGIAASITANIQIDGATATAVTDTYPVSAGLGLYNFDMTQGETNGDHLLILPSAATSDVIVIGTPTAIYTTAANSNDLAVTASTGMTTAGTIATAAITTASLTAGSLAGEVLSAGTVLTQASAALTAYDPPTKTEMDTKVGSVQSDIAALNNVSTADILTQASAALTSYDPPTKTEMDTKVASAQSDIAALENLSAGTVLTQASAALTSYDPPTRTELTTDTDSILVAVASMRAVVQKEVINKNATNAFTIVMVNSARVPLTGLSVSGERNIEGGGYASMTGTVASAGYGSYRIVATAADTNGDDVVFRFSASGADDLYVSTKPSGD